MAVATQSLQELCINSIRFLAVDAIEKSKSGHPGLPMGAAPMAFVLWDSFMRYNPKNPLRWYAQSESIIISKVLPIGFLSFFIDIHLCIQFHTHATAKTGFPFST